MLAIGSKFSFFSRAELANISQLKADVGYQWQLLARVVKFKEVTISVSQLSGVLTFLGGCQVGTTQTNTSQLKKYILFRAQQSVVDVNQLCAKHWQMSVNWLLIVVSTDWKILASGNKFEVALAGVGELQQTLTIGDKCSQAVAEVSQKWGHKVSIKNPTTKHVKIIQQL